MAKEKKTKDTSTEEKIIAAARKLFTQNGYAATKTRDIANEAGINLALLNYYFRSKEKLFEIVMLENLGQFMAVISNVINDEGTTYEEKIDLLVESYIEMLISHPDIPLFILNEIKNHPEKVADLFQNKVNILEATFLKQLMVAMQEGKVKPMSPIHILMNILGLTVFPFVSRHVLENVAKVTPEMFNEIMQERKKLVPVWIKAMLKPD